MTEDAATKPRATFSAATIGHLQRLKAERWQTLLHGPVEDFVPAAFPGRGFEPPRHLAPFCRVLERAFRTKDRMRICFSVPPQHGKTFMIIAGIVQAMCLNPTLRIGFASYRANYAQGRSVMALNACKRLGVAMDRTRQAGGEWRTAAGGYVIAGGQDSGFTGQSFDVLVIDDPYDGRLAAESAQHREGTERFIVDTLQARVRAIILEHARWHPDDAIGIRERDRDWKVINMQAECEDPATDPLGRAHGELLWPTRPAEMGGADFTEAKKDQFTWSSLYQGRPRPRGGHLFEHDTVFYDELPKATASMFAIGFDLAYSANTMSDKSVVLAIALIGGVYYVLDVDRWQAPITEGRVRLREFFAKYPHITKRFSFTGGQERGILGLLNENNGTPGLGLSSLPASAYGDKFVRAQQSSVAWNDGRIRIPSRQHPHMGEFVRVVSKFTGQGDREDDDVDALTSAVHLLHPYEKRTSAFEGKPARLNPYSTR